MNASFSWLGRRVFVTGHTGFKGAWLCAWLRQAGAEVSGYALAPEGTRSLYDVLRLSESVDSTFADVRNLELLERSMKRNRPEIVFHLAAQALVRDGYRDPVQTFETNAIGTLNVLQAMRHTDTVRAGVIVTTDKCYEPRADGRAFCEKDRLGGYDPYSASKACAELIATSMRASFFQDGPIIATARAGNVIGGGDWSRDRLVPDAVRAAEEGRPVELRHPSAIRPWQHVFDPLHGYMVLGMRGLCGDRTTACAWNFGPAPSEVITVRDLIERLNHQLPQSYGVDVKGSDLYENPSLLLDSNKARDGLNWTPQYTVDSAIEITGAWYGAFLAGEPMRAFSLHQLENYARLV